MSSMYCVRCSGKKKIYKVGSGYSLTNSGGAKVDCPLCLGTGTQPVIKKKRAATKKKELVSDDEQKES